MTLGEYLKEKRLDKGHSQVKASKEMGVSQYCITKIETGQTMPHITTLLKISKYTKTPVSELRKML